MVWGHRGWGANTAGRALIEPYFPAHLFQERVVPMVIGERARDQLWGGPVGVGLLYPQGAGATVHPAGTSRGLKPSSAQSQADAVTVCLVQVSPKQSPHWGLGSGVFIWKVIPGRRREGVRKEGKNQWKVSYWAGYGCDNGLHLTGGALRNNGSQSHASEGCGAPVLCGWRTPQGTLTSPYFWSAVEHTWQISISSKKTWRLAGRATWTQETDTVLPKCAKGPWAWIPGYRQLISYCVQDTSALLGLSFAIYKVSMRMIPNS